MNVLQPAQKAAVPPVIDPATPPTRPKRWPLVAFAAMLLAAALARAAAEFKLPTPLCWLRTITGVPCPTCGSTRVATALTHGDWLHALHLNPLATLAAGGVVLAFIAWLADAFAGTRLLAKTGTLASRLPVWRIVLAALALNWLYLILTGGR